MQLLINVGIGALVFLYPIAVYFGIQYFEPWQITTCLLLLLVFRLLIIQLKGKAANQWDQLLIGMGIIYCLFVIWLNNAIALLFYPVLISFSLLMLFLGSLFSSATIIERLARLQHPDLPEQGIRYTRTVTQVWCVFFFINGSIALVTALWCSFAWWSLYNGVIAYVLMAALMSIEYLVRIKTQSHINSAAESAMVKASKCKTV